MKVCYQPHLDEKLVSTKIETEYDAVNKIKAVYEAVMEKVKASFTESITAIKTEADKLNAVDITTSLDEEITERVEQADFASLTKVAQISDTPAIAKQISAKVCREIAYIAVENEKQFITTTRTSAGKIAGLATASADIINHISSELDKNLVVVNDLWSIKDQEIANLEAQLKNSVEELNLLQQENDELKERVQQLEANVVASFDMAITDQKQLQDKQQATTEKIDEILKTKVNSYIIDTTPLQDEKGIV